MRQLSTWRLCLVIKMVRTVTVMLVRSRLEWVAHGSHVGSSLMRQCVHDSALCLLQTNRHVAKAEWFTNTTTLIKQTETSSRQKTQFFSPKTALSVRGSDLCFSKWFLPHLLIDVSILVMSDCTDPHFLIIFLVVVLVRVFCGIVGLHLCQRRTDVAGK